MVRVLKVLRVVQVKFLDGKDVNEDCDSYGFQRSLMLIDAWVERVADGMNRRLEADQVSRRGK